MKTINILALSANNWESATFKVVEQPINEYESSTLELLEQNITGQIFWYPQKPPSTADWDDIIKDVLMQHIMETEH